MTLQEMQNQITDLGTQIRAAAASLRTAAMQDNVTLEEVEQKRQALNDMQQRMNALQAAYDVEKSAAAQNVQPAAPTQAPKSLSDMLKSNEDARAFAYAIGHGINPRNGRVHGDRVKILYDALTESGGDPVGTDGGFLVPEDIDHQIRELKRDMNPLAPLFGYESVSSQSGWRVVDTAPTTGFTAVNEMATVPSDDQPAFAKITYTLTKYGLILPVSNELANDEVANLFGYIARWFAKKDVILENSLLITALQTLSPTTLTGSSEIRDLKKVLNVVLDPAISANAVIITNQSGFDALDALEDNNGRGLLQPDPTNATMYRLFGHPVHVASNAALANTNTNSKADIFIGDGKEFATLFVRQPLEIVSTDIGGAAFTTDSIQVRGITRKCVTKFDAAAMARRNIAVS